MKTILIITLILYVIQKCFENYISNNVKEALKYNMNILSWVGGLYTLFRLAYTIMLIISIIKLIIMIF